MSHPLAELIINKLSPDGTYSPEAKLELEAAFKLAESSSASPLELYAAIGFVTHCFPASGDWLLDLAVRRMVADPNDDEAAKQKTAAFARFQGQAVPTAPQLSAPAPKGSRRAGDLQTAMIRNFRP
jgi:hypothetical protein